MKSLTYSLIAFFIGAFLAFTSFAGPEAIRDYKDSKTVASVPPPPCNWQGFYVGVHIGGQFGNSDDEDLDGYLSVGSKWSYNESGIVAGGQIGYNWQWNWLVFGPEFDLGYMNLDGKRTQPGSPGDDTRGETNSDFYTTFRGRLGVAANCWLFYATGGGIGVNYHTRVVDDNNVFPAGGGLLDASKEEFDWGYTVGGGIERKFGSRWSIKVEYLYFNLGDQTFSAVETSGGRVGQSFGWKADTDGHIVRTGLNFHF